jgi:hypothetical protein
MNKNVIDKEATLKAIIEKCKAEGIDINAEEFDVMTSLPDAEEFIIDSAIMIGVDIIYK